MYLYLIYFIYLQHFSHHNLIEHFNKFFSFLFKSTHFQFKMDLHSFSYQTHSIAIFSFMVSESHFTTEFLRDIICDRESSSLISILEFTCLPSTQFLYRSLRFKISRTLIIRQMQTKTTMRYHLIPVRMTINKKSTNNKCWQVCRKKRESSYIVGGNINWCSHYGKYGSFLKN